jgi:HD-GYP domain-containing protein (c-di-GMP phosphodiesterase class II)
LKRFKDFIKKNILFQYSILSLFITLIIGFSLIYILVGISRDHSIELHSSFYYDFIESIPKNFPEVIPVLENKEVVDDHVFEHFLTDLQFFSTLKETSIYTDEAVLLWSFGEPDSMDLPYMKQMIGKALDGNFAYHILREGNSIILHTFYPIIIKNKILGVVKITDIDDKTGFTLDEYQKAIIRVIIIGGLIFYALLFFLFFNSYMIQKKAFSRLEKSQQLTLYSMSLLAELRDNDTGSHILRTKEYCRILAENLRKTHKYRKYLSLSYIEDLERSAPLHDIGKVGISDSILLKPGKLTDEEFRIIKNHPKLGADVLKQASESLDYQSFFEIGIQIVLHHHENWDGSGYPDGLSGEDIPLSARIMAIADVYDALRTERPYKKPKSHDDTVQIIIGESGNKFDPEIIKIFIQIERKFKEVSMPII